MTTDRLTVAQACRRAGVSDSTLRRLIRAGDLEVSREHQGRRTILYIEPDALDRCFATGEHRLTGPGAVSRRRASSAPPATADRGLEDALTAALRPVLSALQALRDQVDQLSERVEDLAHRSTAKRRAGRSSAPPALAGRPALGEAAMDGLPAKAVRWVSELNSLEQTKRRSALSNLAAEVGYAPLEAMPALVRSAMKDPMMTPNALGLIRESVKRYPTYRDDLGALVSAHLPDAHEDALEVAVTILELLEPGQVSVQVLRKLAHHPRASLRERARALYARHGGDPTKLRR